MGLFDWLTDWFRGEARHNCSPHTEVYGPYERNMDQWGKIYWTTNERGIHLGDVRLIKDELYYASSVYLKPFRKSRVIWAAVLKEERIVNSLDKKNLS